MHLVNNPLQALGEGEELPESLVKSVLHSLRLRVDETLLIGTEFQ